MYRLLPESGWSQLGGVGASVNTEGKDKLRDTGEAEGRRTR